MPRRPAPCGTYPAYRRHLRKQEPVDPACRRAQQKHDAERSGEPGEGQRVRAAVSPLTPRPRSLVALAEDARLLVLAKARESVAAVDRGDIYGFIDRHYEIEALLEEWCDRADDVEHEARYPGLSDELRASLLASRALS